MTILIGGFRTLLWSIRETVCQTTQEIIIFSNSLKVLSAADMSPHILYTKCYSMSFSNSLKVLSAIRRKYSVSYFFISTYYLYRGCWWNSLPSPCEPPPFWWKCALLSHVVHYYTYILKIRIFIGGSRFLLWVRWPRDPCTLRPTKHKRSFYEQRLFCTMTFLFRVTPAIVLLLLAQAEGRWRGTRNHA